MIHVLTLVKVKNSSCSASLLPKKQNILIYQGLIFVLSLNIVFKACMRNCNFYFSYGSFMGIVITNVLTYQYTFWTQIRTATWRKGDSLFLSPSAIAQA